MPSEEPPRLPGPPPLPGTGSAGAGEAWAQAFRGRLHPLTLVMIAFRAVRGFVIPGIIVLATGSQATLGLMLLFLLGLNLAQELARYFTFTYALENGELVTRKGILERRERHIPLARVQDVRMEQGVIHRLLGVVDLHVETAGGHGAEASLSVLSRSEAEALRAAVFQQVEQARARGAQGAAAAGISSEIVRRLGTKELLLEGLTSNRAASVLLLLAASWQFLDDLLPSSLRERTARWVATHLSQWVGQGGSMDWLNLLLGSAVFLAAWVLFSAVGSVVLFHGFVLSRRGEDLCRSYGLLTKRTSSLPRQRIQVLKVEESWLRRLVRAATLRADTASSRPEGHERHQGGHDVLLPLFYRRETGALLRVCFPDLEGEPGGWTGVSRCAVRRGTVKAGAVLVLLGFGSWLLQRHAWAWWPLALVPVAYLVNLLNFRYLGYAPGERYFQTRRGWISRATHLVPVRNVQTVVIRQNPLDRRFGVASLDVDTAGQAYTGGGPHIRNLPLEEARGVARTLASRAAAIRYRAR